MSVQAGFVLIFLAAILFGCGNKSAEKTVARADSGTFYISCDESFKPVIDAQVQVYKSDFPKANIIVQYKPEADCLRDLLNDSIGMVIATRAYTPKEKMIIADSANINPDFATVAYDAIAVLVHPQSADSFFTVPEIKDLLSGKSNKNLIPVLDGLKATSTVRFMLDSILRGLPLGAKVTAAQNSNEVIDYVSRTANAVGFIGISWIGNADDTAQVNRLRKVRLARLESTDNPNGFVLPVQYLIYTRTYPFIRSLVYTVKDREKGIGNGFANFMRSTRGQLIFRRSYIFPAIHPSYIRDAQLE